MKIPLKIILEWFLALPDDVLATFDFPAMTAHAEPMEEISDKVEFIRWIKKCSDDREAQFARSICAISMLDFAMKPEFPPVPLRRKLNENLQAVEIVTDAVEKAEANAAVAEILAALEPWQSAMASWAELRAAELSQDALLLWMAQR